MTILEQIDEIRTEIIWCAFDTNINPEKVKSLHERKKQLEKLLK